MSKWGDKQKIEEEVTCSLVGKPDIYLEVTARQKIFALMEEYNHREWLAYLVGKKSEQGNFFVEDIVVPPHKESYYASAEAEPFNIPTGCIGVIHSHHSMGAFHSGTDQTYVDRNFPVSITVSNQNSNITYDAVSIQTTPCGKVVSLKGTVKYVQPKPTFDEDEWMKKAKENIDKGKCQVSYAGYMGVQSSWEYKNGHLVESKKDAIPETVVKSLVPINEICKIQQSIRESHGVDLTRAEVEDAMDSLDMASKLGSGWGLG